MNFSSVVGFASRTQDVSARGMGLLSLVGGVSFFEYADLVFRNGLKIQLELIHFEK